MVQSELEGLAKNKDGVYEQGDLRRNPIVLFPAGSMSGYPLRDKFKLFK